MIKTHNKSAKNAAIVTDKTSVRLGKPHSKSSATSAIPPVDAMCHESHRHNHDVILRTIKDRPLIQSCYVCGEQLGKPSAGEAIPPPANGVVAAV